MELRRITLNDLKFNKPASVGGANSSASSTSSAATAKDTLGAAGSAAVPVSSSTSSLSSDASTTSTNSMFDSRLSQASLTTSAHTAPASCSFDEGKLESSSSPINTPFLARPGPAGATAPSTANASATTVTTPSRPKFNLNESHNVVLDLRQVEKYQKSRIVNSFPVPAPPSLLEKPATTVVDILNCLSLPHLKVLASLLFSLKGGEDQETRGDGPSTNVIFYNDGETESELLFNKFKHFNCQAAADSSESQNIGTIASQITSKHNNVGNYRFLQLNPNLKFFYIAEEPLPDLHENGIVDAIPLGGRDYLLRILTDTDKDHVNQEIVQRALPAAKRASVLASRPGCSPALMLATGKPVLSPISQSSSAASRAAVPGLNSKAKKKFQNLIMQDASLQKAMHSQVSSLACSTFKSLASNSNSSASTKAHDVALSPGALPLLSALCEGKPEGTGTTPVSALGGIAGRDYVTAKFPKWIQPYLKKKQAQTKIQSEFTKIEKIQEHRMKKVFYSNNSLSFGEQTQLLHSPLICSPRNLCPGCDKINYKLPSSSTACANHNKAGKRGNRYYDILPFEHTRVKVAGRGKFLQRAALDLVSHSQDGDDDDSYINANFLSVDIVSPETYIATQDPVRGTFREFWAIVAQHTQLGLVLKLNSTIWNMDYYKKMANSGCGAPPVKFHDVAIEFQCVSSQGEQKDTADRSLEKLRDEIMGIWQAAHTSGNRSVLDMETTLLFFGNLFSTQTGTAHPLYYKDQHFVEDGLILKNTNHEIIINEDEFIVRVMELIELEPLSESEWEYYRGWFCSGAGDVSAVRLPKVKTSKCVLQVEMLNWKDFSDLQSLTRVLKLVQLKRFVTEKILPEVNRVSFEQPSESGNVKSLTHCSAGCGRTGTFITIDIIINCIQRELARGADGKANSKAEPFGEYNLVYRTVTELRKQRLSMVQNLSQYKMCYDAVTKYLCLELAN